MSIELETERLWLRQWRAEDFDRFFEFYQNEPMSRYVGGLGTKEQAWRRLAMTIGHWSLRGFGYWAVEEKASRRLAGCVGLWHSATWPEIELGYWLMPDMHGKGYAREAGRKSLEFGFGELRCTTLVSYIHPDNEPSKRVAESLGGRFEGIHPLLDLGPHCIYRYAP